MQSKEKIEKLELTRKQIDELTQKIRKTIDDFNSEIEVSVTTYNCEPWVKSPLYHPRINVIKNRHRIAIIEINFDVNIN